MTRAALGKAALAAGVLAAAVWAWQTWWPSDERAIRRQLDHLVDAVNENPDEGVAQIGDLARAARIGGHFTDDVVVDLGQGSAPIHGRETLMALAARLLQTGSGRYTLDFDDVGVAVHGSADAADVSLAATLTRRHPSSGEQSVDARELQLGMRKVDEVWRIARVNAVDTLRRE